LAKKQRDRRDRPRHALGGTLVLEDSDGYASALIEVKTGSKQETIRQIKKDLRGWMENKRFEPYRRAELDVAIVAKVNKQRMNCQDVDNIAKDVLDALQKHGDQEAYLFEKDSQVTRLLVWKQCKPDPEPPLEQVQVLTDELTISFRRHDPDKQMILVPPQPEIAEIVEVEGAPGEAKHRQA